MINNTKDLRRLSIEDANRILSHHNNFKEILDFRDAFTNWKQSTENENNNLVMSPQNLHRVCNPVSLKDFLFESAKGRMLCGIFNKEKEIDSLQKKSLIRLTVDYILRNIPGFPNDLPHDREYKTAANQLISAFPNVFTSDELLGVKYNNEEEGVERTRGKMQQRVYDMVKYSKKKERRMGGTDQYDNLVPENTADTQETLEKSANNVTDDSELNEEDEIDMVCNVDEEDPLKLSLNFVKTQKGPEVKVLSEWKNCFSIRKDMVFEEFPALSLSFGYKLILSDFEEIYPGKVIEFRVQFNAMKKKSMHKYNLEITDKVGRERIIFLESASDEKVQNLLYFSILPFLFPPKATKATNMKRTSVSGAADLFILSC